jgi:hypothetical protein
MWATLKKILAVQLLVLLEMHLPKLFPFLISHQSDTEDTEKDENL